MIMKKKLQVGGGAFRFLPRRSPMFVVVGEPIPVTRVAELGQEDIDRLHALYVKQMRKLQKYNPVSVYCKYFYKAIMMTLIER